MWGGQHSGAASSRVTWVADEAASECMACAEPFSLLRWRHHCRGCGAVVCDACAPDRAMVLPAHMGCGDQPQRVCTECRAAFSGFAKGASSLRRLSDPLSNPLSPLSHGWPTSWTCDRCSFENEARKRSP